MCEFEKEVVGTGCKTCFVVGKFWEEIICRGGIKYL